MGEQTTATDCSRLQARLRDMLTFANADGLGPFCGRDVQELIDAFASIPSASVSMKEIIAEMLPYLSSVYDEGPEDEGWQSDQLKSVIARAQAAIK